jgi:hypothetical protein
MIVSVPTEKRGESTRALGRSAAADEENPVSPVSESWVGRVPHLRPGTYADGLPLHDLNYICFKMILRPNRFDSRDSLFEFTDAMEEPAEQAGVTLTTKGFRAMPLRIREVLFVDTHDLRLYKNSFILRRRIPYRDGFPIGDPEIVFKFRHPDLQVTAETDVRPQILGAHRVKFKCQALPLKERLGGLRLLYSHNIQFPRSAIGHDLGDVRALDRMIEVFPVLACIRKEPGERVELVGETIIEEVLQQIGKIDFGDGVKATTSVSLWRTRGEHRPLIGEFDFNIKFQKRRELVQAALRRAEEFAVALQYAAKDWISLTSTKTGAVYRLHENAPCGNE